MTKDMYRQSHNLLIFKLCSFRITHCYRILEIKIITFLNEGRIFPWENESAMRAQWERNESAMRAQWQRNDSAMTAQWERNESAMRAQWEGNESAMRAQWERNESAMRAQWDEMAEECCWERAVMLRAIRFRSVGIRTLTGLRHI